MLSTQKSEVSKAPEGETHDPGWPWKASKRKRSWFTLKVEWRLNIGKKGTYVPDKTKEVENAVCILGTIKETAYKCGALCILERTTLGGSVVN